MVHVVADIAPDLQEVTTEHGPALNYVDLTGKAVVGETVILNRTARLLDLGTGGYDFVMARFGAQDEPTIRLDRADGHLIKGRYTPFQCAVQSLEEITEHSEIWERRLDGMPVIACQLHSQIAPVAAGLALRGKRAVYVMTDAATLPIAFSKTVRALRKSALIAATITAGQAFGGDYETVTVYSALLGAGHLLNADAVIIGQGPGNAGTGTRYGFSGIEQAALLDATAALGGTPIACVRMSDADSRERHQGISHHTRTSLALTYPSCLVPLPHGTDASAVPPRHQVRFVEDADRALDLLEQSGITVKSMGRARKDDPIAFQAAAAAGLVAAENL